NRRLPSNRRANRFDRREKTVTPPGNRLNETRILWVVPQRRADLRDANIQGPVEIYRSAAPDLLAKPVPVHNLARIFRQQQQRFEGLRLKTDQAPVATQLAARSVDFERAES